MFNKHILFFLLVVIFNSYALHFTAENSAHHTVSANYELELWQPYQDSKSCHIVKTLRTNSTNIISNDIYENVADASFPPPGNLFFLGVYNVTKECFFVFKITLYDKDNHVINRTYVKLEHNVDEFKVNIDRHLIITFSGY